MNTHTTLFPGAGDLPESRLSDRIDEAGYIYGLSLAQSGGRHHIQTSDPARAFRYFSALADAAQELADAANAELAEVGGKHRADGDAA